MLLTVHSVAFNILRRSSIRTTTDVTAPSSRARGIALRLGVKLVWFCHPSDVSSSNRGAAISSSGKLASSCEVWLGLKKYGNERWKPINTTPVVKDRKTIA